MKHLLLLCLLCWSVNCMHVLCRPARPALPAKGRKASCFRHLPASVLLAGDHDLSRTLPAAADPLDKRVGCTLAGASDLSSRGEAGWSLGS